MPACLRGHAFLMERAEAPLGSQLPLFCSASPCFSRPSALCSALQHLLCFSYLSPSCRYPASSSSSCCSHARPSLVSTPFMCNILDTRISNPRVTSANGHSRCVKGVEELVQEVLMSIPPPPLLFQTWSGSLLGWPQEDEEGERGVVGRSPASWGEGGPGAHACGSALH